MRCLLLCLALSMTNCAGSSKQLAKSHLKDGGKGCFAYYQEKLKEESFLWGFGDSGVRSVAIDAARADLAKQISVHISSTSQVQESNSDAEYSMISRSLIDQHLDGVQVDHVCQENAKYQAVVKIPRSALVRSAEQKLSDIQREGKKILAITQDMNTNSKRIQAFVIGRDFLADQAELYRNQLTICQTFQGCREHDSAWLSELQNFVRLNNLTGPFMFQPEDEVAKDLQSELLTIVSNEGYQVSLQAQEQVASAVCHRTVYEKSKDLKELLVRLQCKITGQVEGIQVFQFQVAATGFGDTPEQAYRVARNLLKKENVAVK